MRTFQMFSGAVLTAFVVSLSLGACGGAKAGSGLGKGKGVPPPPPNVKAGGAQEKREFSKDTKKDFTTTAAAFAAAEKSGWNESTCRGLADRFSAIARDDAKVVEAHFMAGLSLSRCNLDREAEAAFQNAKTHAASLSELGRIYLRAGKVGGAKQYFESALKANGKLVGARINLATITLEEMRRVGDRSPKWKDLEEEAKFQLSSALGVDSNSVEAYTVYGLIYMEGFKKNKNRLDLAKVLLDEAKKRDEKSADLQNAYGLYYLHKNAQSEALKHFRAAVELNPKFAEARMNTGLITLAFRDYEQAKEQFTKVIELQPKNYDAIVGLGAALRGVKDFDGAEREYKKALQLDSTRGEAFYNLGVLYKDFLATKQEPQASIPTYRQAKDYFQSFLQKSGTDNDDKSEAKEQIKLIDKTVTQTEKFLKMLASQPKQPEPTPAPAPAPK